MIARLSRATRAESVRRNHALEHAAITVVAERHPGVELRGRSNRRGFYILGEVQTDELRSAVSDALQRLQQGEARLAIHDRCGTNLAVAGIMSGLSAALATQMKPRQNRFSYAILASLAALWVAPRVGTAAQRHLTTLAELGDMQIEEIDRRRLFGETMHWVRTRST